MSLESTAIFDRRVYAQDTSPDDTRDGVLWVDTSSSGNDLYVYDAGSSSWVLAAPENVHIQNTEPAANTGEIWVDTSVSPPTPRVYDGTGFKTQGIPNMEHSSDWSDPIDMLQNGPADTFYVVEPGAYDINPGDHVRTSGKSVVWAYGAEITLRDWRLMLYDTDVYGLDLIGPSNSQVFQARSGWNVIQGCYVESDVSDSLYASGGTFRVLACEINNTSTNPAVDINSTGNYVGGGTYIRGSGDGIHFNDNENIVDGVRFNVGGSNVVDNGTGNVKGDTT